MTNTRGGKKREEEETELREKERRRGGGGRKKDEVNSIHKSISKRCTLLAETQRDTRHSQLQDKTRKNRAITITINIVTKQNKIIIIIKQYNCIHILIHIHVHSHTTSSCS